MPGEVHREGRGLLPIRTVFLFECVDCVGLTESEGSNAGPAVGWFLERARRRPEDHEAWCAASMNAIAEVACMKKDRRSPLELVPLQAYVPSYYETAERLGWFTTEPRPGDLFLLWHQGLQRYRHIGCMRWMNADGSFQTAEGNSNDDGSAEGKAFVSIRRDPPGPRDVFINPWGD